MGVRWVSTQLFVLTAEGVCGLAPCGSGVDPGPEFGRGGYAEYHLYEGVAKKERRDGGE